MDNYEIVDILLYNSRTLNPKVTSDNIINRSIFAFPPFGKVNIDVDKGFKSNIINRSLDRLIHGNTFLGDLYDAYIKTDDIKYLDKAIELVKSWIEQFGDKEDDKTYFHDETTALRLTYWLKFYQIGHNRFDDSFKQLLRENIELTTNLLKSESFYSKLTNHGMFQDLAVLAKVLLFSNDVKNDDDYNLVLGRLLEYFDFIYTIDGVHKEHAPDYHYLVTTYVSKVNQIIKKISKDNLNDNEKRLEEIFVKSEKYAMHIIQPDLFLPKISDCNNFKINEKPSYYNLFTSPEFNFVKTQGRNGVEPKEKQVIFENAGYFISRSNWKKDAIYFLFLASYNVNYHKHSDDLSFILYKDGDIFIDAGPYGYDYEKPETKYAYSSHAHSTLLVNGESLPRIDNKFDRVFINDFDFLSDGDKFTVEGINKRFANVIHSRTIIGDHENEIYSIKDKITSNERREYSLLFQISHKHKVEIDGNILSIIENNTSVKVAEMEFEIDDTIKFHHLKVETGHKDENRVSGYEFLQMGESFHSSTIKLTFYAEVEETNITTTIRLKNFKRNNQYVFGENNYGLNNINYFFKKVDHSDKLLIVFSAMSPSYNSKFNYYTLLKDVESNILFIRDSIGEYGNYYSTINKNYHYETEVISLILNHQNMYSINNDNVVLLGSSKGGYAALYFGMKYGFKNVISGGPQFLVGDFVLEQANHNDVGKISSGGIDSGDKRFLNHLMININPLLKDFSNYYICIGTKDHHLNNHVKPLLEYLNSMNITNINVKYVENARHSDLKYFFKEYIYLVLNKLFGWNLEIDYLILENKNEISFNNLKIDKMNDSLIFRFNIDGFSYDIVYYIYHEGKVVYKSKPVNGKKIQIDFDLLKNNRLKFFIRGNNNVVHLLSNTIRNHENINFNKL